MAAEAQQGGNSSVHIGRQNDPDTIIDDPRQMSRKKRQFTNLAIDPSGETIRSESIRGSVFGSKPQSGKLGGAVNIDTEVYINSMTDYVQAAISGDPHTQSTDVPRTTVYDGEITPEGEADGTTVLKTFGDSPDITITQPEVPGQLQITVAGGTGSVTVRGARRTALGTLDLVPEEEKVDLDSNNSAMLTKHFARIDELEIGNAGLDVGTASDLDIVSTPGLRKTVFTARNKIFEGLTVQGSIGEELRLAMTACPNTTTFNISDTIRMAMNMLARAAWRRRTVEGGTFQESLVDTSDLVNDPFIENTFFPYYGGLLVIDGDVTLFDSVDLNIGLGLRYAEGKRAERQQIGIEREDGGASITGTIQVNFISGDAAEDTFIRWDENYRDNKVSTFEIYAYYWTDTGKQYWHKITLHNVALTEIPQTPVSGRGNIKESLAIEAVSEGTDPVISWEINDDDGWFGVRPLIDPAATELSNDASTTVTIRFERDVTRFALAKIAASAGTLASFEKVSDSEYTVELTAPASGEGVIDLVIAKNAVPQGNAETAVSIPYAA